MVLITYTHARGRIDKEKNCAYNDHRMINQLRRNLSGRHKSKGEEKHETKQKAYNFYLLCDCYFCNFTHHRRYDAQKRDSSFGNSTTNEWESEYRASPRRG